MKNYFWQLLMISSLMLFPMVLSDAAAADSNVLQAQVVLKERGFDPGPLDGIMGPRTRAAIRAFQSSRQLSTTGALDGPTREALGLSVTSAASTTATGVTVPAGTQIPVTLNERLDSGENRVGDQFSLTVSRAIVADGQMAIPEGSLIRGTVTDVESAERPQKGGRLVLTADSIEIRGRTYAMEGNITAEGEKLEGEGSLEEDLARIAIGAGVGAVIGGLTKGKKGALAGLIIGGAGIFLGTKGEQVELTPETPLLVELKESFGVTVPVS